MFAELSHLGQRIRGHSVAEKEFIKGIELLYKEYPAFERTSSVSFSVPIADPQELVDLFKCQED
jgi:hypothetical protein